MRLLIRADAAAEVGLGHVMRCLGLAQAWQSAGGEASLAAAELPDAVAERLSREGVGVHRTRTAVGTREDAQELRALAEARSIDWLVLDGYRFDLTYQQAVSGGDTRTLVVDDGAAWREIHADLVVNQNLHAHESLYRPIGPSCELLLGPRYVMLRREFQEAREVTERNGKEIRRVLVTLGGGRPPAALGALVDAVAACRIGDPELFVVLGAASSSATDLDDLGKRPRVRLVRQPEGMADLLAMADLALSAAGSTTWELASLGVPALVIAVAENQTPVARALGRAGIAVDLGRLEHLDWTRLRAELESLAGNAERRAAMAEAGRRTVDGRGAHRVVRAMTRGRLRLRAVDQDDAELLWQWRNDPTVRAAAFDSAAIDWETHIRWFESRLADPDCRIFLALDEAGEEVGQVRFEKEMEEAEIHLSVATGQRGRGWGTHLIRLATEEYSRSEGVTRVRAFVRPENVGSLKAFEAAGYELQGRDTVKGLPACRFLWQRTA